jgi:hypothetical protein
MNRGEKDSLAKLNLTDVELVVQLSSHLKMIGSSNPEKQRRSWGR